MFRHCSTQSDAQAMTLRSLTGASQKTRAIVFVSAAFSLRYRADLPQHSHIIAGEVSSAAMQKYAESQG